MSKEQEYPGMNGWVSIRLTPVGQETDNNGTQQSTSANFESFYLTLKDGCLRWFTDEQMHMGRGCGYIVSKVIQPDDHQQQQQSHQATDAVSLSISQLNSKKPSIPQQQQQQSSSTSKHNKQVTFHLYTKMGTFVMDLRCKAIKYWQSILDLHFVHITSKQSPSNIPLYELEYSDAVYTSLHVTNMVKVPIPTCVGKQQLKGNNNTNVHIMEVNLSLFDNPEELTTQLLQQYQQQQQQVSAGSSLMINKEMALTVLITLLQEQRKLFLINMKKYQSFEKQYFDLQLDHVSLGQRLVDAEAHIETLTDSLQKMDEMVTILQDKIEGQLQLQDGQRREGARGGDVIASDGPAPMTLDEILDHHTQNNQQVMSRINSRTGLALVEAPTQGYYQQPRSGCTTPTGRTTGNNWKVKYDTIVQQLEECQEQLKTTKSELQRMKKSKPLQQIELLSKENRQLREYSIAMRNEVITIQQQMDELQQAALATVEELQQQNQYRDEHGRREDDLSSDEEDYYNHHGDDNGLEGGIDIDLTQFALGGTTSNNNNNTNNKEWKIEDFITSSNHPPQQHSAVNGYSDEEIDHLGNDHQVNNDHNNLQLDFDPSFDNESQDWTRKYQDFIDAQASGGDDMGGVGGGGLESSPVGGGGSVISITSSRKVPSLLMKTVMKSMKWPLVEERILSIIYDHYSSCSTSKTQGMTMTRFFRFAKDFMITTSNVTGNSSSNNDDSHHFPSSSGYGGGGGKGGGGGGMDGNDKLIYGEVSMIFTNASKLDTDDVLPIQKVFKVRSNTYDVISGNSNNPINAILTRNQFSLAIEALADRLYTGLVKQITGVYSENLTARERKQALRATLELLWIKTLVPCCITQDLIPWSLVYLQELLVGFNTERTLLTLVAKKAHAFVHTFSQACCENKQDLKKALKICTADPQARFVQQLRMNFATLTKVGKTYAIVPYLIGEHQYYSIFKEVACWVEKRDPKRYPIVKLPSGVQSALDSACDTYYQEQLKNSSMMLNIWSNEDISAALVKPALSGKGGNAKKQIEELLTIEKFILTLGAVAMQAFSSATSVTARMENLIQLLEKGNAVTASKKSGTRTPGY